MKNVKSIIGFLYCLVFCTVVALGVPKMAKAEEEIAIDETNFPDDNFRNYIIDYIDINKNGQLSKKEITETTWIFVSNEKIKNLKGIEYFTALTNLDCGSNELISLDVSKNTALIKLYCSCNNLKSLNINGTTALTNLNCSTNELTSLDISTNTNLKELQCNANNLTSLNINGATALTNLNCGTNELTFLDISKNTNLKELQCNNNNLISLNINGATALTKLDCFLNELTILDINGATALKELKCSSNRLVSLDISENTTLAKLNCDSNKLTELDVNGATALEELECNFNNLVSLDVSKNTTLTKLNCGCNKLNSLNVNGATALEKLHCSWNELISLDVNGATALRELECYSNELTFLDVNETMALTKLNCVNNQLTSLDVSKNTALIILDCANNNLTELRLHSQTYNKLLLNKDSLHDLESNLSDLKNISITNNIITVNDITKPATYKVNGKEFTIIYADTVILPSPEPSMTPTPKPSASPVPSISPVSPSDAHIFSDYNYNNPVTNESIVVYGNGKIQTVDGKKVNNKVFTVYTDILASYKYTLNSKGIVKPSVGKVIVAITKSNEKPAVNNKNKITDTSASKIAKAKIKNGQITVTAVGKEGGLVYLWVIDTGNKGVSAYCPIDVKLAPTKLEVQDKAGSKLAKNTELQNGKTLDVCITGLVGSTKTKDGTYKATVASKYQSYITVTPIEGSTDQFTIKAIGLKNNKKTKVTVTFTCDQNNKKTNFSLTLTE